jgi:hypothetical protein
MQLLLPVSAKPAGQSTKLYARSALPSRVYGIVAPRRAGLQSGPAVAATHTAALEKKKGPAKWRWSFFLFAKIW